MTSKEVIIICLDVSPSMREKAHEDDPQTPLQTAVECIQWIVQRRIFSESKDEMALILLGTKESANPLSQEDQYQHVSVVYDLQPASWDLIKLTDNLPRDTVDADFLDGLVIALDVLHSSTGSKKFGQKSIVLFSNVGGRSSPDQMDAIVEAMKNSAIDFAAIGPLFNDEDADDTRKLKLSPIQIDGEKIVQNIIDSVDGTCLSLKQALPLLSYFSRRQAKATAWKCNWEIGTDIRIPICMYVKTKENKIKQTWKYMNAQDSTAEVAMSRTVRKRVIVSDDENEEGKANGFDDAINGTSEKTPADDEEKVETVSAYKYGTTLVPLDKLDLQTVRYKNDGKSFKFLAFTSRRSIRQHYFVGDGVHVVLPDASDPYALTAFSAMLHAMLDLNVCALIRYAYNVKANPRLGALIPEVDSDGSEYFVFITLPFSEDCRFFPFASLNQDIIKPSDQQVKAVEDFVDSLTLGGKQGKSGVFNPLEVVNPYVQYVFQCLQHRQMYPNDPLPQPSDELMSTISPRQDDELLSRPSIEQLKNSFKLEVVQHKADKRTAANVFDAENQQVKEESASDSKGVISAEESVGVIKISTVRPTDDFAAAVDSDLSNFETACLKLSEIIHQFIFDCIGSQLYDKASECLEIFREKSIQLSRPGYYNRFISTFKAMLLDKDKIPFWNTICEKKYGLINVEESSSSQVTTEEATEFLQKEKREPTEQMPVDEPTVGDDLLDELE